MTVAIADWPHPLATAQELFALYRQSGLLHPGPPSAPSHRLTGIETAWSALLGAGPEVLRVVLHRSRDGAPIQAGCAFAYAPGTWQLQHLISAARHQPAGTLAVMLELIERLDGDDTRHVRFTFRPDDPGVAPLLLPAARLLHRDRSAISLVDYGTIDPQNLQLPTPTVPVRRLAPDEYRLAETFYARCLHPVERASLALEDLELDSLDARYRAHRLTRRRTVLAAYDHDRVIGLCIIGRGPFGMNLSFLEHAVEYLRIARDRVGTARRDTWSALLRAAAAEASGTGDWLVTLTDPEDRPLARAAGLVGLQPSRYAIVTIGREAHGFRHAIEGVTREYARTRPRSPTS